jgi:hypothetical protein
MRINVVKRGMNIINGNRQNEHHQRKSSRKSSNENRHVWNENQHGE